MDLPANAVAPYVIGRICLVQEERFRLVESSGRAFLFTLSHRARASLPDVQQFERSQQFVVVEYEGVPGLANCVARSVRPFVEQPT